MLPIERRKLDTFNWGYVKNKRCDFLNREREMAMSPLRVSNEEKAQEFECVAYSPSS